jgi:glycine/D-amino acid oxidase-like deaminating enzyme
VSEGVWTTTGHEGSGVGLGPISGRLLAQLIAGETPEFDVSPFDPRRFA